MVNRDIVKVNGTDETQVKSKNVGFILDIKASDFEKALLNLAMLCFMKLEKSFLTIAIVLV